MDKRIAPVMIVNPKRRADEAETSSRDQKLRKAALGYVNSLPWKHAYAVTLTLKTGYFSISAAKSGKFWIALDAHHASKNLRHFLNLLERAVFKKSKRRKGGRLRCVAVIEDHRVSPHLHLCLDRPDQASDEQFCSEVIRKWHQTYFGNVVVDVKPCTDTRGWLEYMAKFKTKSEYSDSIDWMNLQTGCAV